MCGPHLLMTGGWRGRFDASWGARLSDCVFRAPLLQLDFGGFAAFAADIHAGCPAEPELEEWPHGLKGLNHYRISRIASPRA